MPRKTKGKVIVNGRKVTNEKKTKLQYIASLFRKGWSKLSVSEEIQKKWGCKPQMAAMYIRDAYEYMSSGDEAFIKNLRRVQLERLELILMKVMEKEDWKTANQIIDTINKTFALYEIKTKVEISDNTIQFKFGDNPVQDAVIEGETTKAIETSNDENNDDENDDIE